MRSQHQAHPHQMNKLTLLLAVLSTALPLQAQVATIQAGDSVELILTGVPANDAQLINGVYRIDKSGRLIGLPFLDSLKIQAVGLSERELAANISATYKDAQIYPDATVNAKLVDNQKAGQSINIGKHGQATRQFPYRQKMTIFDAVMAAGGVNKFGPIGRVIIIRRGNSAVYDLRNDQDKKATLLPDDTIIVNKQGLLEP